MLEPSPQKSTKVYALYVEGGHVRYVGKTTDTVEARLRSHRAAKQTHLPVVKWARKHRFAIKFMVLEEIEFGGNWQESERFWIAFFRSQYDDMLNLGDGGEGWTAGAFSAEHKARIAAALRTGSYRQCSECGEDYWHVPCQIRKRFCSVKCTNAWQKNRRVYASQPVTPQALAAAAAKRKAISHCPSGHPYSGDNLHVSGGRRHCRACGRAATARYKLRSQQLNG